MLLSTTKQLLQENSNLAYLVNSLASDKITRVLGVVNGTSNFMMTKMVTEGWSYEDALAEAQRLGFAESDPTNMWTGLMQPTRWLSLASLLLG